MAAWSIRRRRNFCTCHRRYGHRLPGLSTVSLARLLLLLPLLLLLRSTGRVSILVALDPQPPLRRCQQSRLPRARFQRQLQRRTQPQVAPSRAVRLASVAFFCHALASMCHLLASMCHLLASACHPLLRRRSFDPRESLTLYWEPPSLSRSSLALRTRR